MRLHVPHLHFPVIEPMFGCGDLVLHGLVRLLLSLLDATVLRLEGMVLVSN